MIAIMPAELEQEFRTPSKCLEDLPQFHHYGLSASVQASAKLGVVCVTLIGGTLHNILPRKMKTNLTSKNVNRK